MTQESAITTAVSDAGADKRRHPRTRKYGAQSLLIECAAATEGTRTFEARLWDFSEGGLGMDSPEPLASGEVVKVQGTMRGVDYSLSLSARARVAYCRRVDANTYRIGVGFVDVSLRRVVDGRDG